MNDRPRKWGDIVALASGVCGSGDGVRERPRDGGADMVGRSEGKSRVREFLVSVWVFFEQARESCLEVVENGWARSRYQKHLRLRIGLLVD